MNSKGEKMNKKRAEELKQYANGIHIGKMNLTDLTYVLEEFYGINTLNSKLSEKSNIRDILATAKSILQNNGLTDPALLLRPIDSFVDFSQAYLDDMVYLSYMQQVFAEYEYIKQISNLPMSSAYAENVLHASVNAYGVILGFRRRYKKSADDLMDNESASVQPLDSSNHQNSTPISFQLKKDIFEEENKNIFYSPHQSFYYDEEPNGYLTLTPYTERIPYAFNYACSDIIATLARCYDCDPFVWRLKGVGGLIDCLQELLDTQDNISPLDFDEALHTLPAAIAFHLPAYSLTADKLIKFYKELYRTLKNVEKREDCPIPHRHKCNLYIVELLFGFKFYKTTLPKINRITGEGLADILHYISECPCCFTRITQAECIIKCLHKGYFYNGHKYHVHSDASYLIWRKNMLEFISYICGTYLPALYYCFLYLCIKHKKQKTIEQALDKLSNSSIFKNNATIMGDLQKNPNFIGMYKLRADRYLQPISANQEKFDIISESCSYLEAQIEKMESNIRSISKNIF